MKRYSDNFSPGRWKRICPPAQDSDSDSSSDSDSPIDSEFWGIILDNWIKIFFFYAHILYHFYDLQVRVNHFGYN